MTIIYISCSESAKQFESNTKAKTWLAVPHGDSKLDELRQSVRVNGIPEVVVLRKGEVVTRKGVATLRKFIESNGQSSDPLDSWESSSPTPSEAEEDESWLSFSLEMLVLFFQWPFFMLLWILDFLLLGPLRLAGIDEFVKEAVLDSLVQLKSLVVGAKEKEG